MTTAELALFLATDEALARIAQREDAADFHSFVLRARDDIERMINRPHPRRLCGECLHVDENRTPCGEIIWANHDDIEVTCRRCGTLYNVEELIKKSLATAPQFELLYTSSEVLEKMEEMGQPISERTWRWWRANGKITPRSEWDCEQRFQLNDVIRLRNKHQNAA